MNFLSSWDLLQIYILTKVLGAPSLLSVWASGLLFLSTWNYLLLRGAAKHL